MVGMDNRSGIRNSEHVPNYMRIKRVGQIMDPEPHQALHED